MSRRSPQEKKALSYARDLRNIHGENDKSSRRNIRRNKRMPNRVDRRREHQVMARALGPVEPAAVERADTEVHMKSMRLAQHWRKFSDVPLSDVVIGHLQQRAERGMVSPAEAEARIERARRLVDQTTPRGSALVRRSLRAW